MAAVAVLGAAGWWGWSSLQQALADAQGVFDRKSVPPVSAALGHPGGAAKIVQETQELAKLREAARQRLEKTVHTWQESWREASGEGADWSKDPGKWKDRLIQTRSLLFQRSRESEGGERVSLPDDFYLSLGDFRQKSPSPEEVPALARQLSVAQRLVEILIQARKESKEAYPTPCVLRLLERTGPDAKETALPPEPGSSAKGKSALPNLTFRLRIDSSPEVLFGLVQGLAKDPWLFLVRDLLLENEQKEFPSRNEIRKKFEGKEAGAGRPDGGPSSAKLLEVLAGKEKIQSTLIIEYVGWASPPTGGEKTAP